MTTGPMMLLKGLGIDPQAILQQVEGYGRIVIALKEQMDRIEASHKSVVENLLALNARFEIIQQELARANLLADEALRRNSAPKKNSKERTQ